MDNPHPLPRRKRARLVGYDYSSPGMYFVTVNTSGRAEIFGQIEGDKMVLSAPGLIARMCLQALPKHYSYLTLDEFVIMPDHIHTILLINGPVLDRPLRPARTELEKPASISEIVRAFKSFSSRRMHELNLLLDRPIWQRGMNDRIIRDHSELLIIRQYIRDNPSRRDKTSAPSVQS